MKPLHPESSENMELTPVGERSTVVKMHLMFDWHSILYPKHSLSLSPATLLTAVTHFTYSDSAFFNFCHQEQQGLETHGSSITCMFLFKHQPALELYCCLSLPLGLNPGKSPPSTTMKVPSPDVLQHFHRVIHHYLRRDNYQQVINSGFINSTYIPWNEWIKR